MHVSLICMEGTFVKAVYVANSHSFGADIVFAVSRQMATLLCIFLLTVHKLLVALSSVFTNM